MAGPFAEPAASSADGKSDKGKRGKGKKGRGRLKPTAASIKADKEISDAWKTGRYKTYAELANEKGITKREVGLAIGRHRKR